VLFRRFALFASLPFLPLAVSAAACGSGELPAADAGTDAPADVRRDVRPPPMDAGRIPLAKACVRSDAGAPDPFVWDGGSGYDAGAFDAGDPGDPDAGDGGTADGGSALSSSRPLPQVVSGGGPVLRLPEWVPITYANDDSVNEIEDFVASVGCTDYWHAIARDYGVGEAITAGNVRLADTAPKTISDDQIAAFLRKKLEAKDPAFPPPKEGRTYLFFFPAGTRVTLFGEQSCQSFGGYHFSTSLGDGTPVAYAVMPWCGGFEDMTVATSHEMIEAATDPYPAAQDAFHTTDPEHLAWAAFAGAEVADMCEFNSDTSFLPNGYPFMVARSWSNAEAFLGRDPCVPQTSGFWAAAMMPDAITIDMGSGPTPTRGLKLAVGETKSVPVRLWAESAVTVSLQAYDGDAMRGSSPSLSFAFTPPSGKSGDVVQLAITKKANSPSGHGAETFMLRATMGGRTHVTWAATQQ
jgi:hypothetical protein